MYNTANVVYTEKVWRSEVIVNIFSMFWLNDDPDESSKQVDESLMLNSSPELKNTTTENLTKYIPSMEQMRAVRMLVKHFHFFVNSKGIHPNNAFDLFKGELWSTSLKRKIYKFLCYSFDNWPMDASFRLVLETWLSYIQPWRYTANNTERHKTNALLWNFIVV